MFTFQTEDDRMIQLVQNVSKSHEVSADELQFLLACRAKGKLDFLLIDIREMVEYSALSIKGTDVLLPTSTIHLAMDELVKRKNSLIILYCYSSSRTFQMVHILKRMGFSKIAHLEGGIMEYRGEKLKNAPLPQNITCKG
mgnify:FL=1